LLHQSVERRHAQPNPLGRSFLLPLVLERRQPSETRDLGSRRVVGSGILPIRLRRGRAVGMLLLTLFSSPTACLLLGFLPRASGLPTARGALLFGHRYLHIVALMLSFGGLISALGPTTRLIGYRRNEVRSR